MSSTSVLPVIDLSDPDVDSLAAQVGSACENVGFFAVVNHGVDDQLIDRAFAASRDFFDLPDDDKLVHKSPNESEYPYGYERSENLNRGKRSASRPLGGAESNDDHGDEHENPNGAHHESLDTAASIEEGSASTRTYQPAKIPPRADLKETFSIGPSNPMSGMPPRMIPSHPPELSSALQHYYTEMERLASRLLRLFARALRLDSDDWFEPLLTHHLSALRILNYFEFEWSTDSSTSSDGSSANDSQIEPLIRAGEHTDYGALTILRSGGPGLQLRKDRPTRERTGDGANANNDSSEWVNVPDIPGAFVINIGDMMQRWTNDKWVSTLHRVVVDPAWFPAEVEDDGRRIVRVPRRQSMAFFCQVNGDATIVPMNSCGHPPKYPPITAREHIMNKHLASMGIVSDST